MAAKLTLTLSKATSDTLRAMAGDLGVPAARLARWILENGMRERLEAQFLAAPDDRAWEKMFELAEKMPRSLAQRPKIRRLHAFALNRSGDGETAEKVLRQLLEEEGPSTETCGLLGRVYKDRWQAAGGEPPEKVLEQATETYLQGHEADPSDPYPGINALTLMALRKTPAKDRKSLLKAVKKAVAARREAPDAGYWDHATRLELAIHQNDEAEARAATEAALEADRVPWMIKSTLGNLALLRRARKQRDEAQPDWVTKIEKALEKGMKVQPIDPEDLEQVAGVGPLISKLLRDAGIGNFSVLGDTEVSRLQKILDDAGPDFQLADPATWPEQSALAAAGRWRELRRLQDQLVGGRRVG